MRRLLPLCFVGLAGTTAAQTLERTDTLRNATDVRFTTISPDGKQIAAACRDQKVRLFSLPAGALGHTLDPGEIRVSALTYSRNSRRLAVGGPGVAQVYDSLSGARVAAFSDLGARVDAVALSPDGLLLAVAPLDLPPQLFDVATGKRLASLDPRFAGATGLAFAPDGKLLVTINADTTVRAFAPATGRPLWTFEELDLEPFTLDFTSDSKTVVVAGADKIAVALDTATGTSKQRLPRQPDPIGALSVIGNRTVIASCINADRMGETRAILAWDMTTGAVKTVGHGQSFNGGAAVADGRLLLTAAGKDGLELWAIR